MTTSADDMEDKWLEQRAKRLGYEPQKELIYNSWLPYADQLDDESERLLQQIRTNFAKAVMLKELKPGCAIWSARLIKYIKLYGLKFSKECHIELIRLVYELIVIPDLEPTKLHKFCTLLILLTKAEYLISPAELSLPWKPLYDTSRRVFTKSEAMLGMYHYLSADDDENASNVRTSKEIQRLIAMLNMPVLPYGDTFVAYDESLESTFAAMIQHVKTYFPETATREILDHLLPRFTPWHNTNSEIVPDLVLYLPTNVLAEKRDCTIKLWLDDLITLYQVCHNGMSWESDMMALLSNVANTNVGYIDWDPYLPTMFTKFLRSLNLPVCYKQTQNSRQHTIDASAMTSWIVSTLGPKSSTQKYLDHFMTTIATYIQGANQGKWSNKLRDILKKLAVNFVARIHLERYNRQTWEAEIPDSHKLTEEDITKFVQCLLAVAFQGMFCRSSEILVVLQQLAILRPAMVIAPTIEKLWSTLDSLTEPHKMTSAMQCIIAVARPLANGFNNGFPEGPTHIVPLLFSSLPGLDPNDFKKMAVTLAFISVFANLIPMVNCSEAAQYYDDLTEEELTVCEDTAQFEDFTLQYFDRVFVLIESNIMEHTRMEMKDDLSRNRVEIGSEHGLMMTTLAILSQIPTQTFKLVLKKMYNFVTQRILETKVAGLMTASLCKTFSKVNAVETFKLFIPYLCDSIINIIRDNEGILKEENLDKELLYYLLILAYVVDKNSAELLPYMDKIYNVVDKGLNLTSKEGYKYVCYMLKNMILGMSNVRPKKCHRSNSGNYDAHVKDFLAIREWGKPGNIWDCDLEWHVPSQAETDCVQTILNKYLPPELDKLNKYVSHELVLTREELNKCLTIVNTLMMANSLMPPSENTPVKLVDSSVQWESFDIIYGTTATVHMPDGGNIRQAVSKTMHALQAKLLSSNEDDTKSLCKLISIWEMLVAKNNSNQAVYEKQLKLLNVVKRSLENKLIGRVGHHRIVLVERALLQHEFRTQAISGPLSVSQADSMMALLTLATSRYSEVRMCAQVRINWIVANYAYSFQVILPSLVEFMKSDPEKEHERLKGTLFCLLGPKLTPIVARHEWSVASELWPAIIHSSPSEKPSIIRLMELLTRSIIMNFPTITIKLKWTDSCVERARDLLTDADLNDPEFVDLLAKRDDIVARLEKVNVDNYSKLLNVLIEGARSTKLNWRHSLLCTQLLQTVVHNDIPYPPEAVKLILDCLIHDTISVRRVANKLMVYVYKQTKRVHRKVDVDMFKLSGISEEENRKLIPGYRPDNLWLQYDGDKEYSKETWDGIPYINKENFGFYYWQKTMEMYAPVKEHEQYQFSVDKLNPTEKIVYDFFMSKDNVDKLINFLSMEEKKGKDKFNVFKFLMYKGLFSNYYDEFLPLFLPHLERLVSDKQEALQRCASEIIAGLIRATKHWPFDKMENLKIKLTPILKLVCENMTAETFNDWGTCIATAFENMDVSRLSWILNVLEERMGEDGSSAWVCGRLFLLQAAIIQHPWKLATYSHILLDKFQSKDMLSHPYQIVRDRIASVLTSLYEKDIIFPNGTQDVAPSIDKLLETVTPQMEMLFKEGKDGLNSSINHSLLPVLSFGGVDTFPGDSGHVNEPVVESAAIMDKLKFIIQDSIMKCGLESNNINATAVNKLIQEVQNVYINDSGKDLETGISSPIESFMNDANIFDSNSDENLPFVELLEERLSSALKISELDMTAGTIQVSEYSKEDTQNDINVRLFKTMLKWMTTSIPRNAFGIKSSFYVFLPPACMLGSRKGDEELYQLCSAFLSSLADSLHTLESLECALNSIDNISQNSSWSTRICCISFMQSLLFHNMPLLLDGPLIQKVTNLTLDFMVDNYPEVREAAAKMLSGLLHTGILSDIPVLLNHFKSLCKEKLVKGPTHSETLAVRHCGVLGLCAFVAAHPYTVPPFLSEIFSLLGAHLNDPLPIPATIRKTLNDFKRTHHDDWQSHQLKFTEEELALLTDLTVPPSYYA